MAETRLEGAPPAFAEAIEWLGMEIDDAGGSRVGRVHGVFADARSGEPAWLIVALGRCGRKKVPVPARDCAAMVDRVWTADGRREIGHAPTVDPARPLLREHELAICSHYGIGERVGRAAELAGRPEGTVTARPG